SEIAVTINRTDYYQIAYLNRKGFEPTLRAEGLQRFQQRIAGLLPALADRVDTIRSLDDVKFLDVKLNRLPKWYLDGFLCIGDAAHAMSPIGGVGINLAIQDGVAAARLLAAPLRGHRLRTADLAGVQARRRLPTTAVQGLQRMLHRVVMQPATTRGEDYTAPLPARLVRRLPALRVVP